MADQNKKKYIKYENTTYELVDGEARSKLAEVEKAVGKELNILVLGNSFSQDSFAYLPPVLNELLPGYNITYGVAYEDGCGAIKHMEMYQNDQNYDRFWLWRAGADHWSRYAGGGVAGYSLRKIMPLYDWDIVYMQSRGSIAADAMEQDMTTENITLGRELLRVLQDGISHNFTFLTGQWLSFVNQTTGDTLASYFRMRKAIKYVADRLGVDGVIPVGAGIAFARMDAALDALGEDGHMIHSDGHQQAGLPALISTYVIAQYILGLLGREDVSVYGSTFVPNLENATAINATNVTEPSKSMTHGEPVGVTTENILKAQEIAVAAAAHPDSVYGETDQSEGGSGAVTSVNGKTGAVVLDAEDVGAYVKPDSGIPASDLADAVKTSLSKANMAFFPSVADITELWHSVSKLPAGAWEDYSWHQCPEAVRNYIANVDYDGVAYTESSVGTYAPTPAVPATNTKPIGQTVDGVTFYNIRPNSNAPYATANKSGVLNPLDQVRWINSATSNFRDLGGWPCDGGTVKYGLLYRSGNLNAADEDLILNQLGITVECDLTADGEPAYPDKMRFIGYTSYAMYSLANTGAWQTNLRGIFDAVCSGESVVFHCSMGADRTGTLACILEGLLGVSQSDIDKDYELTSFYAERARNGNYQGGTTDWAHLIAQILALDGDSFRDKCVTFVKSLGFTASEINAYRHAMIDGNPEDIEALTTTYTVTNTLTNCTTNNQSSSADGGGVYAATITANSGYTLTGAAVSITMGGTDITSTAYNNGAISIDSVTGNIVIVITAATESQMKELFDPAAATLNQRFSSSGSYSALDGNFCTDYIPVSGLDASEPWRIHIKDTTDSTIFRASVGYESVLFCKSDKSIVSSNYGRLAINTNTSGTNTLCKHSDSAGGVYVDINRTGDGNPIPSTYFDLSQVAYIRVCMGYNSGTAIPDSSTLANVSITADNITN